MLYMQRQNLLRSIFVKYSIKRSHMCCKIAKLIKQNRMQCNTKATCICTLYLDNNQNKSKFVRSFIRSFIHSFIQPTRSNNFILGLIFTKCYYTLFINLLLGPTPYILCFACGSRFRTISLAYIYNKLECL